MLVVTWYGSGQVQSVAAYLIAWLLLLAAPRPLVELLTAGRRRRPDVGRRPAGGADPDPGGALDPAAPAGQPGRAGGGRQHPRSRPRLTPQSGRVGARWLARLHGRATRGASYAVESERSDRAHWQGEVVRRREGLRLPVPGGRTRRLRARRRPARRCDRPSRRAPASSSASPRAAAATRRCRSGSSTRPRRCSATSRQRQAQEARTRWSTIVEDLIRLLDGVGEAYRARPAPRRPARRSRPPSCCARSPTSSSSRRSRPHCSGRATGSAWTSPVARSRVTADDGVRGADDQDVRVQGERHERDAEPEPRRVERHARCRRSRRAPRPAGSVVSLRANALACTAGDVALDGGVEGELRQRTGPARP